MKRVVDGKAYNTDTAEAIATKEERTELTCKVTLYRTPKGNWFTVEEELPVGNWKDSNYESIPNPRRTFRALPDLDTAFRWVNAAGVELVEGKYFPSLEEA
jgi:hypothetical protein